MGNPVKFLYEIGRKSYLLTLHSPRELRHRYPKAELVRQFHDLESARNYCEKLPEVIDEVNQRDKFDSNHRQKLAEAKMGSRNPNAKGLSESHKKNIGKSMRGKNVGPTNINFGRPRSSRIKLAISQTKKLQASIKKRRWVVSDSGKEFLVTLDFNLPAGWSWGRKRLSV